MSDSSYQYQNQPFDVATATLSMKEEESLGHRDNNSMDSPPHGHAPSVSFAQPLQSLMTERFPLQSQCEDRWAAIAFVVQLGMTVLWAVSSMSRIREELNVGLVQYDGFTTSMLFCAFWGVVLSIVWLYTMSRTAQNFVLVSSLAQVGLCLMTATFLLARGFFVPALAIMTMGVVNGLWLFAVRDRIAFAGLLLEQCCRVISMYSGVAMLAMGTLLIQMIYIIFWSSIVQDVYTLQTTIWMPLLIVMFFWTSQVLHNVVYTTVAGVMATWYYMHNQQADDPTVPALKRALTTSFGSVCLGSLGIFWVRLAETVARSGAGGNPLVSLALQKLQDFVDQAVQYFNAYALVHSAVYGKPYMYAAMDTVHLVRQCGLGPLVGDSLVHPLTLMTSVVGGSVIGSLVALATMDDPAFLCAWLVGAAAVGVTMAVVSASIVTVFVCFAEEPETLRLTNPDLHHRISHLLAGLQEDGL